MDELIYIRNAKDYPFYYSLLLEKRLVLQYNRGKKKINETHLFQR